MIWGSAIVVAFVVGFAVKLGGLCTYAAALQIVETRRFERLFAFLGAAAWAALLVVPLAWAWDDTLQLTETHTGWAIAALGGAGLGVGAYLNRGCVFGTFVQLTSGNLTYVATVVGMAAGSVGARHWLGNVAPVAGIPTPAAVPSPAAWVWLAIAAVVAFIAVAGFGPQPARKRLDLALITVALGVGGGALFAAIPRWNFAAVVNDVAWSLSGPLRPGPTLLTVACTVSMAVGALMAAVSQHRFTLRAPRIRLMSGHFAGGALMGGAAVLVPGGNDDLLLSGIPVLAFHAIVGFTVMVTTMVFLLKVAPNQTGYHRMGVVSRISPWTARR